MLQKIKAFTLVEMLVTLAIAGILLAVGVPYLRDFIQNNRAASLSNTFVTW